MVKRAKETPSVSQSSPSSENNEDDFEKLADLETETVSQSGETLTSKTFLAPLNYCGRAMRGNIGKPNYLKNIFGKPDSSYNMTGHSTNFPGFRKNNDQNTPSTRIKKSPELKAGTNCNEQRNLKSRLNHHRSRNNKGFSDDVNQNSLKIPKPRIVISCDEEPEGTEVEVDPHTTSTTPCNEQVRISRRHFFISQNSILYVRDKYFERRYLSDLFNS